MSSSLLVLMPVTLTRQLLTVALALVVAGLVLELVDADLGALGVLQDLAGDGDLGQVLASVVTFGAVDDQGDGQRHRRAGPASIFDLDHVTDGDLVLLCRRS